MRKRHFRYYCRMFIKTAICFVPIFVLLMSVFVKETDNWLLLQFESFLTDISNWPVNSWYGMFTGALEIETGLTVIDSIFMYLPLYFIWVEIFDLLLHLVLFIPDLFHKWLGGDK